MELTNTELAGRVAQVRARIDAACARASRASSTVTLVAVSKTVPAATVAMVRDCGVHVFGENRAQELVDKADTVAGCTWHMIGTVQTNKVKSLVARVALWHTVDRVPLVDELVRRGVDAPVLLQVNVGAEATKGGCARAELPALLDYARLRGLDVRGLMGVPPQGAEPSPHFEWLREAAAKNGLEELSMGMSSDYETAIAHGSTLVRVGSAIFGPRLAASDAPN